MDNRIINKLVLFENNSPDHSIKKGSLDQNSILIAEFNYAMQTAFQANEDRVRVFQFIIANILTVAGTIFISIFSQNIPLTLFGLIFLFFVIWGVLSLFQLSRLRIAWLESVVAMNKVKDYYLKKEPELEEAFLWKSTTVPQASKKMSLAYLLALSIILLNSLSFTVAITLLFQTGIATGLISSIVSILLQLALWERLLKE